ncbi:MAG: PAS domain-containing protein [Polyangiaceae bacterium]|nr:PAS domain-containing protein [Polyangiaceae bacterium]
MNQPFLAPTDSPPASFEPLAIDTMSDADLDTLDVGVVGLDETGTILRYNLYESRLARLDRAQVLGRKFFDEVAKCTRGAFEARFRALVEAGGVRAERFPFVFDFAFGAQEVEVEIVRPRGSALVYLLVTRTRATGVREDFPAELRAVQQRALAPGEVEEGVRRDDLDARVLQVPWSFLASLRTTCERLAPETWTLFCHEWGVQWGRRLAVDLETEAIERHAKGLRELSMRAAGNMLSTRLREQGWGRLVLDFRLAHEGLIIAELARSAVAESTRLALPAGSQADGGRSCHLLAGCLGAVLTHLGERRIGVVELDCSAMPRPGSMADARGCTFVGFSNGRRDRVDAAIARGARTADDLVEQLRGGRELG